MLLRSSAVRSLSADIQYFRGGNSAEFVHAQDGFLDQIVWARSTGRNTNHERAARQPIRGHNFRVLMQIEMRNLGGALELIGSPNEVGRQLRFSHLGQMRCVRTVVSSNHQKQIHPYIQQLPERFLSLLVASADTIKKPEIFQTFDSAV